MSDDKQVDVKEEPAGISISDFLEGTPPGTVALIAPLVKPRHYTGGGIAGYQLITPDIQLHCPSEDCNGVRFFRRTAQGPDIADDDNWHYHYVTYACSNCMEYRKTFSLAICRDDELTGKGFKFGELPEYGPPTPARLIKLIGPDREIFLKGRRCENQGLGIGAFVYYRRVVENQKNRILDEIIKVSVKLSAPASAIALLEAAKAETQFSKALANVKDAVPQSLLINGHNPLLLLHSALSDGLHQRTDEQCLEIASSVRVVLAELSDRLGQALKDEAELTKALSKLMGVKAN